MFDKTLDKLYGKTNQGSLVKYWLDNNSLQLNIENSCYLHFNNLTLDNTEYNIVIDKKFILNKVSSIKYLELYIDNQLKSEHSY